MIVLYRLSNEQLDTILFVDNVTIHRLSDQTKIRYLESGRGFEKLLKNSDIEYLEVKPD